MTNVSPDQSHAEARQQALGQARMWRNLALQCLSLADRRMAAEAEAVAMAYERRAEKLQPAAAQTECTA